MEIKFLKLQKVLTWIPIINFFNFFLWAFNCTRLCILWNFLKPIPIVLVTELSLIVCLGVEITFFNLIFPEPHAWLYLLYYIEGLTISGICILSQKYMSKINIHKEKQTNDK